MNDIQEFGNVLENIAKETRLRESAVVLGQSQDYIDSHRDELLQLYPDRWIAVHKQEIVGADKDILNLVRKLRASGVPLKHIALEMLSREEIPIAL